MDVVALDEGFDHVGVFAEVGHDAQLDLRVVGREEFAAVVGDEGLADLLAVLVADGDVLQIGVARAEPARGGDGLVERRMDTSRPRVDELGQGFDVGAQQLLQAAVLQYLAHDVVLAAEAFWPVLVFLGFSISLRRSKSTSPTCFGEAMLKAPPASV